MANLIYNSSGSQYPFGVGTEGYNFVTISGSLLPITSSQQPKVKGGAATNLGCTGSVQTAAIKWNDGAGTMTSNLNSVMLGSRFGYYAGSRPYRGTQNGTATALTSSYSFTGLAPSGINQAFTGSIATMNSLSTILSGAALLSAGYSSGITTGLSIPVFIGPAIVTSGVGTAYQSGVNANLYGNTSIISVVWSGTASGSIITAPTISTGTYNASGIAITLNLPNTGTTWGVTGPVNYQGTTWNAASPGIAGMTNALTSRAFIAQRLSNMTIAGVANTTIQSGGNAGVLTRSINRREKIRTTKITTALRNGYYDRFTGKWLTAPSIQEDSTNVGLHSDTAAMVNPELWNVTASGYSGNYIFVGLLTYKWGWPNVAGIASAGAVTQTYKPKTGTSTMVFVTGWQPLQ